MGIFDNSKFGTFDAAKLRSAKDQEVILTGITLADDDSYFQLDFVGAYSSRYETHPRFWEAKRMESKTGKLLLSLEKNLGMNPVPSSMEELIGHRLMVRTYKEDNFRGDKTEYWEIIEDLGPGTAPDSGNESAPTGITYSAVAELVNGHSEDDAWDILEAAEDVMNDDALGRDVEDRVLLDVLEEAGFIQRVGDLIKSA